MFPLLRKFRRPAHVHTRHWRRQRQRPVHRHRLKHLQKEREWSKPHRPPLRVRPHLSQAPRLDHVHRRHKQFPLQARMR